MNYYKLIGVQSNHGVEYFGGPAAPTDWFPHNAKNGNNYLEDFFLMINEITLLHTIVLIWFLRDYFPKKYWYWILILQYFLDTDTASFFFKFNTDTDTSVF